MRKFALTASLGAATMATGLIAPPQESTTASQEPTTGHFEQALQRDLDLSSSGASRLPDQERRARAQERRIRDTIGDAFGGAVFDVDTGELTVSITDPSAAPAVEEAGARARVVRYGEGVLDDVVAALNAEPPSARERVTGWYTDLVADTVVVTVTSGMSDEAEELIAGAGVDTGAVRVMETPSAPRTFAPIIGGDGYIVDGSGRCSIGFSAEDGSQSGFVTAGHCAPAGASVAGEDGGNGAVARSSFPGNDMGWVVAEDDWSPTARVNTYGGEVTVAGTEEAQVGSSVCRSGSTTGWRCGTIEAKNQTVIYPEGSVFGLTRTDACAEPGDSGGPFLSGDQAQGVISGGSGDCESGGATFFQPVGPILEEWGLELLTG